jgi:medium-chain acyl-[acyl-carrier-protein] hydrolase
MSLPRLICFPYAGGNRHVFAPWQSSLQGKINLVAPELPGRGRRIMEPAFNRVHEAVDWLMIELRDHLSGDFSFWGHSMGALLAYELTRELLRRTGKQPRHVFVTAALPPGVPRRAEPIHALDDSALISKLSQMNGTPDGVLSDRELMAALLPCIRADFAVCETHVWTPQVAKLHVPITAIGGDRDQHIPLEELAGWHRYTSNETRVLSMKGDHFFLRDQVDRLTELFIATLTSPASVRSPA